jgi:hypothetical protein
MVNKNTKSINQLRKKQGKKPVYGSSSEDGQVVKGRSWFVPILLAFVGVFCFVAYRDLSSQDGMYWVTGSCYIGLALFIFFVRRPFIRVGKAALTTRKFSGNKTLEAHEIESITVMRDAVIIQTKNKKARWIFSRFYQLINIGQLTEVLTGFAEKHAIPVHKD